MFKSIFAKYVTVFTALLLCGFLLLLLIFGSVVGHDMRRSRQTVMQDTTRAAAAYVADMFRESGETDFSRYLSSHEGEVRRVVQASLTNASDATMCITDRAGEALLTVGEDDLRLPDRTELDSLLSRTAGDGPLSLSADKNELCYGSAVFAYVGSEATSVGTIILRAPDATGTGLSASPFETVLLAAVWVMIAALIALYFITERTIGPLREMSRAAKKMAVGSFDTRVTVRGRDEVAQLAEAFDQMAESLCSMERMRNAFIANVSHDLRTPMTTIAGFIDGILDGVIPPEQREHYLRVVSGEVRRLSRLVNQLLDISRLQAGNRKLVKRSFDICEMGRQILIAFEQKIDEKGLDVSFDCDEERMFVLGDQDAVHQILYNICDNAVKFSREGGQLRLSFGWQDVPGVTKRKVVIRVYNEGQGIPPEDLPYIFERFYKSDKSRSLDKTGVGLGMYIAKTIIEAHGEHISVRSEYGKDCEFTFTLPETEPPEGRETRRH